MNGTRTPRPHRLVARLVQGDDDVMLHRHAYSTSSPIDLLASGPSDAPSGVLRKDLSPGSLLPTASATKPAFLLDPRREIAVYRDVLPAWLGAPAFHGAVEDEEHDRHWLFVEHVDGVELWQVGELDVWMAVARWLAALHDAHLEDTAPAAARELLIRYDRDFYRRWATRASTFASDADAQRRLAHVLAHHDELVDRLLALPTTFVHGELYPSNVLVASAPMCRPDPRIAAIDWETAAVGPALVDLAALVEGWEDAAREALVGAYRSATSAPEVAADDLDACRLHLCIRWLGWAPSWSPPAAHVRDWLALALDLPGRLGW